MRRVFYGLIGALSISLGCATQLPHVGAGPSITTTDDGLVLAMAKEAGNLFLREDHGIGGYDAIVIGSSFVNYRRSSSRLEDDVETLYLASLEQAVVDAAESANVRIVDKVNPCVIKIAVGFINLQLARPGSSARVLGEMTLVMEFQDSVSNQSLMRFVMPERINRESAGTNREEHVRSRFDEMIEEVDIISALRSARIVPSAPRPGCKGDLLRAGPSDSDLS